MGIITLQREFFGKQRTELFRNAAFGVTLFTYPSGIEAVEVTNSRGRMVVLPFMGQIIWDLEFDGVDLKMKNMFSQPKPATNIVDTYGCFAFHSGLISNGCPSPADDHALHGEMPCAVIDEAWLEVSDEAVTVSGRYEYVQGFGHHYQAQPSVRLEAAATHIRIGMAVTNTASCPMPLQYMCHMNYAYLPEATLTQNIPDTAFTLRESIPAHVKPTEQWLAFNRELQQNGTGLTVLNRPVMYDPEIVFFADRLQAYGENLRFAMTAPDGTAFFTAFSSAAFNYATRWILYNGDQQVGAFVLPATCRPEGFLAAQQAGTLIMLPPGETRRFSVTTGKQ